MTDMATLARRTREFSTTMLLGSALTLFGAFRAAAQAPAADQATAVPDPSPSTSFIRSVQVGALVDGYYVHDGNRPPGDAPYRNFDTRHNRAAFNMAEVWLNKNSTADQRIGFNVKLNVGPAATIIHAGEPGTITGLHNVEQAYVSYLVPAGKGLQIDVGKFVTQHGAEVIESRDNWNYSRSLLFALAIPYYHMGVRAAYTFNDKLTLLGTIVNGWNAVVDNNRRKSYGVQAALKPVPALSIVQNYMGGPEQPDDNADWRHLSDTTVTYTLTPAVSLMANYDYGKDTLVGKGVRWDGIAGYAKIQANKRVAFSPRVEWFEDSDGFMTGTAQTLKEVTLTGEVTLADNLLWRVEFRHDLSDVASFRTDRGALMKTQNTIGFGVLYSFSTKP